MTNLKTQLPKEIQSPNAKTAYPDMKREGRTFSFMHKKRIQGKSAVFFNNIKKRSK